jgi:hypothetical protein
VVRLTQVCLSTAGCNHPSGVVIRFVPRQPHGARLGSVGRESTQAYQGERAAIKEYDGRLPRDEAERVAWACLQSARDV